MKSALIHVQSKIKVIFSAVGIFTLMIVLLIVAVESSKAQQQPLEMKFRHLTLNDGLSQSTINDVYQDDKGFIWLATLDGLNRYDGKEFKSFKSEIDNPNSMSSGFINALDADTSGYLWASTNHGVSRINFRTHKVKRYLYNSSDPNSLSNNTTSHLMVDSHETLWVTTVNGLNRYVPEEDHFKNYESNTNLSFIFEDSSGTLWVGTGDNGLMQFSREKQELVPYHNFAGTPSTLTDDSINEIIEDDRGALWIGTTDGLKRISADRKNIKTYTSDAEYRGAISDNDVRGLFQDSEGRLWVGTENGLNLYDYAKDRFYTYKHNPSDPQSLIGNRISSIYEDDQNILWVGNWTGGVNLFNFDTKGFRHYQNGQDFHNETSDGNVWSFWEDDKQYIWFVTNGGLNRFDPATREFHTDIVRDDNLDLSGYVTIDLKGDNNGNLWLASTQGLQRYDIDKREFQTYKNEPDNPSSLSHDVLLSLFVENNGQTVWVGTAGRGLDKFSRKTGDFQHYRPDAEDSTSLSGQNVSVIHRDREGILWIGTYTGLNRYVEETNNFVQYKENISDTTTISSSLISSIYEDSEGRLWIGTSKGLNRYHRDTDTFTYYTEKDGLPDNTIYGITEDAHGNLFLSTNFGLSKFNPEKETFFNYDKRDGLQDNEFNIGAALTDSKGRMYFGGINGFNFFHPDSIKRNMHEPPVVITGFELFNQPVPVGNFNGTTYLNENITYTSDLTLSHKDDVFSFEFAALDYAIPEKNRFAYKMEGFEENWNYVGSRNFATYTDLSPGQYTFRVKAANNDGVWNEEGTSLSVSITPPFWQTTWFYILSGLFISAVIFGGYRYRVRSITARNKLLEKEVEERTSELDEKNSELAEKNEHLEELLQELKETRDELVEKAHKAGMADIASGVLHNVGNILNSVNTSASLISDTVKQSKLKGFTQANAILRKHVDDIEHFVTEHPKGKKLIRYYLKLEKPLKNEQEKVLKQSKRLIKKIELINDAISAQQSYVGTSMEADETSLSEMIDNALALQAGSIEKHGLTIDKDLGSTDAIITQRSKLIHVLVNIFKNAKEAMTGIPPEQKNITIKTWQDEDNVHLSIADNGIGISKEHMDKIFTQGFTTKESGHGFGLHSSANYMTEMGGNLSVESEGEGLGTTFILTFPRIGQVSSNGQSEE